MEEFNYPSCNDGEGFSRDQKSPASSLDRLNQSSLPRRQRVQAASNAIAKAGKAFQRINLAKLIDDMEHDQRLADRLEELNKENKNEEACKDLVREAVARCQQEITEHLDAFLKRHSFDNRFPTYEEWIQDVHPENVAPGQLIPEMGMEVDGRFYVEESDHRIIWNERAPPQRQVKARGYHGQPEQVDLLDKPQESRTQVSLDTNQKLSGDTQQNLIEFEEFEQMTSNVPEQKVTADLLDT